MMMKKYAANEVELVRQLIEDAHWGIHYHEDRMIRERKQRALALEIAELAGYKFSDEEMEVTDDEDDLDYRGTSPRGFLLAIIRENNEAYHEQQYTESFAQLACATLLYKRCEITEFTLQDALEAAKVRWNKNRHENEDVWQ